MITRHPNANEEFERFLTALFLPDDLIELRFIESWLSRRRRKSRVVRPARWLRRRDVVALHGDLAAFAKRERANVYFGVCPRHRQSDADDHSIQTVRCAWCDIDAVTLEPLDYEGAEIILPDAADDAGRMAETCRRVDEYGRSTARVGA